MRLHRYFLQHLIVGKKLLNVSLNSHNSKTLEIAENFFQGERIDLLYIDGDHTFSSVLQDYEFYSSLIAKDGLIVFHDIADSKLDVSKFWSTLPLENRTEILGHNFIDKYGTGVLTVQCKVALAVLDCGLGFNNGCAPLNLGYITSYLKKTLPNVEVKVFDGMAKQNVELLILEFQPDVVGVTAVTPQAPATYALLDSLRKNRPDIFTAIGGIRASMLPEEAKLHADCVITGEGEKAFSDVVKAKMNGGDVSGIVKGEAVQNLDDVPSPAFDLIDMKYYLSPTQYSRNSYRNMGLSYPTLALVTAEDAPTGVTSAGIRQELQKFGILVLKGSLMKFCTLRYFWNQKRFL